VLHLAVYQPDSRKPRNHWNKIADETGPVAVVAYSNLPEVTLELNGKVIGSAQPENGIARWSVPWQAGRLVVSGKTADAKTLTDQLESTGPAARIRLTADRSRLLNDGRDAVHVTIELLDEAGLLVRDDDRLVTVSLANPARLAALENGDQEDNTPAKSPSRKTRAGKALAIIQASGAGTGAVVSVSADGLPINELRLDLASDRSDLTPAHD
jgi:beta-galactosidase